MEKKDSLAYIAKFIDAHSLTTKFEFREFLNERLGENIFEADADDLQNVARHLYRAYVVSLYTRFDALKLAETLSSKKLEELLKESMALDKKYGMYYDTVDHDLRVSTIDKKIKKLGVTNYKSILTKMVPSMSPTAIKAVAAAERAKAKEARQKKAGKTPGKTPVKTVRKESKGIKTVKKSVEKKSVVKSTGDKKTVVKKCQSLSIKALKEMAKAKNLSGYSKLNKADLCKLLKIKE